MWFCSELYHRSFFHAMCSFPCKSTVGVNVTVFSNVICVPFIFIEYLTTVCQILCAALLQCSLWLSLCCTFGLVCPFWLNTRCWLSLFVLPAEPVLVHTCCRGIPLRDAFISATWSVKLLHRLRRNKRHVWFRLSDSEQCHLWNRN